MGIKMTEKEGLKIFLRMLNSVNEEQKLAN